MRKKYEVHRLEDSIIFKFITKFNDKKAEYKSLLKEYGLNYCSYALMWYMHDVGYVGSHDAYALGLCKRWVALANLRKLENDGLVKSITGRSDVSKKYCLNSKGMELFLSLFRDVNDIEAIVN